MLFINYCMPTHALICHPFTIPAPSLATLFLTCQCLQTFVSHCGHLSHTVDTCLTLWTLVSHCGHLSHTVNTCLTLWTLVSHCGFIVLYTDDKNLCGYRMSSKQVIIDSAIHLLRISLTLSNNVVVCIYDVTHT